MRPRCVPSCWKRSTPRLGAGFGLVTRPVVLRADLRTHVGSFGSLAPPKVWFSLLQRSPLFTTSIVLSRSELV